MGAIQTQDISLDQAQAAVAAAIAKAGEINTNARASLPCVSPW